MPGCAEYDAPDGKPVFYFHGFPRSRIAWPLSRLILCHWAALPDNRGSLSFSWSGQQAQVEEEFSIPLAHLTATPGGQSVHNRRVQLHLNMD